MFEIDLAINLIKQLFQSNNHANETSNSIFLNNSVDFLRMGKVKISIGMNDCLKGYIIHRWSQHQADPSVETNIKTYRHGSRQENVKVIYDHVLLSC